MSDQAPARPCRHRIVAPDMLDAAAFDPPDVDRLYERYADSCRRLGIEPFSRERVDALAAECMALLGTDPPLLH